MNKVYIVVECTPGNHTVLRVFTTNKEAIAYGESLVFDGAIIEYDVFCREVY